MTRRILFFAVASLALGAGGASKPAIVHAVDSIGMTVADLDRSVEFYSGVLGFRKLWETEVAGEAFEHLEGVFGLRMRVARLQLGGEFIELAEYLAPQGRPVPRDTRANDLWFQHIALVVQDMDRAYQHLRKHKVAHASTGPQKLPGWNPNAGGIEAFYFRDPDGHHLEAIRFPVGKGDPKWQTPSRELFLGIDHTAIVVSDTEASLRFYRDTLGMRVAGASENYGTEQEHLNNVFGARLRITALRAEAGPGIEFLEYLAPRNGRPYPEDAAANDLFSWQTKLASMDAVSASRTLRGAGARFVSSDAIRTDGAPLGFRMALVVRDPDGHALQIAGQ